MATRSGIDQLQDVIDSITPPKKRPARSGIDQLQDVIDSITPPKKRPALYSNSTKKRQKTLEFTIDEKNEKTYNIENRNSKSFKGKVIRETTFDVKFGQEWEGGELKNLRKDLSNVFSDVIKEGGKDFDNSDVGRVYINHPKLNHAIIVKPRPLEELTPTLIMEAVENVLQSEESLAVEEGFTVQLGVAQIEKGSGRTHITNIHRDRINKKSIVSINNNDNMCLARAIAVGLARLEKDEAKDDQSKRAAETKYNQIRRGCNSPHQGVKAKEYHRLAQVPTDRPCSLSDINAFEQALSVQVVVYAAHLGNRVIYQGPIQEKRVYLYFTKEEEIGHFDTIVSITGLLRKVYFCHACLKSYDHKKEHTCQVACRVCRSDNCPEVQLEACSACNRTTRSVACRERHQKHCHKTWQCPTCKHVLETSKRKPREHQCGEWFCNNCQQYQIGEHLCYLRQRDAKEKVKRFIYFDFETRQELGYHIANYVVAQSACDNCDDTKDQCIFCGSRCQRCDHWDKKEKCFSKEPCTGCGKREVKFSGDTTSTAFGNWLFSKQHSGCTVISHNGKAFDNYFLLDYLIKNSIVPQLIYNGSKIMYMDVKKLDIRVVDSMNFFPMKLAVLPKAFGLTELKKGYFPHFFNTLENQKYKGPYPPADTYGINNMSKSDREEFLVWYDQQSDNTFDFQKEMEDYCRSDVDILRRSCIKFRQLMLETTGLDPFSFVTIASVCMAVFRTNFLKETWEITLPDRSKRVVPREALTLTPFTHAKFHRSPIAQVPTGGYTGRDNYSQASIQWLETEARKRGITIRHALNGGEVKVPNGKGGFYKLDGVSGNLAFEYNGCVWHGCNKCYPDSDNVKHPYNKQTLAQRFAITMEKKAQLEALGFTVITKWEHDFKNERNADPTSFQESIVPRLDPRDSFFGGRTNASKLHYKIGVCEQVKYVDFTSLYPTVNKYDRYPVSHPTIITENFQSLDTYFGLVKATVLPPRQLYHPVLPVRCHGKLMFPLCRTCAERKSNTCNCTELERVITGTWTILEVQKALEKGYEIQKIYEIYHFPETTQYNPETKDGGLFTGYVNKFLKIKQESSGWPDWCTTEEEKQSYIHQYYEKEGIKLDYNSIEKNPGLRSLAKLCLNSFWGKFGQRQNMRQSRVITDEAEFYRSLSDPARKLADWHILNDDMVQLEWEYCEDFVPEDTTTNIFLATFTTAHARLRLYNVLDQLGERVIYYDTDSVVYVSRLGQFDPPLGDFLGQLTDELGGHYITEFVSAGPKNYAYRMSNGECCCKVKGFSLNNTNSAKINFDTMKEEVFRFCRGEGSSGIKTSMKKICRDKHHFRLYNRDEHKAYQVVYDKRVIMPNKDTIPYGY